MQKKIIKSIVIFLGIFIVFHGVFVDAAGATKVYERNGGSATASDTTKNATIKAGADGYKYNDSGIDNVFKVMLFSLIRLEAWILTMFVSLIMWTFEPTFMDLIRNNAGLYTGWSTVRDFLNILFIFFLIFSAFATVFQVSKYHIKSTWVMIVVMALLVNFSWPIARVIIDVSNVTMYQILGGQNSASNLEVSGGLMATIGKESNFAALLVGQGEDGNKNIDGNKASFSVLFLGIITGFLFMVTVGAIAFIFVIRIIALAVLLVFASVGFTMAAFPSTRSFANQWWSSFIKYCFIGPILLFTLMLSVNVMGTMSSEFFAGAEDSVAENGGGSILMQYAVVLILIWTGIIASGKLGDGASSMVVGKANAAAKWGGRKLKGGTFGTTKFIGRQADSRMTGGLIAGGVTGLKKRSDNLKSGFDRKYQSQIDEKSAYIEQAGTGVGGKMGKITGYGGDKNAISNLSTKNRNKLVDDQKNTSSSALVSGLSEAKGDALIASLDTLAKREDMSEDEMIEMVKVMGNLNNSLSNVGDQKGAEKKIMKKMEDSGMSHLVVQGGHKNAREVYGGMAADKLAKQKVIVQYGNDPGSVKNGDDIIKTIHQRFNSYSSKNKETYLDSMNLDQRDGHTMAMMEAQNRGVI